MSFEYENYDGIGLAQLVKTKQVKPEEVIEQAIKRVEQVNPKLNAVINNMHEEARTRAQELDDSTTFAGVPMLLKDILQEVKGHLITSGSSLLKDNKSSFDSEYVKQVRKSGVNFIGQTNVPEFALMGITEPALYGPARNPWNTDYTPGGSSGGSAAAVASGMVPIAGANDGGGSIRIPAAFCGLFGMKPTRGRTPIGPDRGRHWQGASVDHILSRSVRDSAAMLDCISINERGAAFHAPRFDGSYLELLEQPVQKPLKIAFTHESPIGTEVDEECKAAVLKTAKILGDMGHKVEYKACPVDGLKIAKSYMMLYFGEVGASLRRVENTIGRKVKKEDVEPMTWFLGLLGSQVSAEEFVLSLQEWDIAAYQMESFHDTYDIYITPTTASPPSKIGELDPTAIEKFTMKAFGNMGGLLRKSGIVDQLAVKSLKRTPFTQLANLTGQPAMTLPLHLTKTGLPCGVQFMAARGREDLLYQLAGTFEQTEHWIDIYSNPFYKEGSRV